MKPKTRGRKVWVVTWESVGSHVSVPDRVAAIFKPQLSAEKVRDYVDVIHSVSEYTPVEKLEIGLGLRENPYPPQFGLIAGVPWRGEIYCGHNPYLYARLVDNLVANEDGTVKWDERAKPKPIQ